MIETAFVFSREGEVIRYHLPHGRTSGSIPDSYDLWELLWKHRGILGGVAHTHPWNGASGPSHTDVTTFAAVEAGLGKRLIWPVVTFTHVTYCMWMGPGEHDYGSVPLDRLPFTAEARHHLDNGIERLRELSRNSAA
jgi:hypothetical protein